MRVIDARSGNEMVIGQTVEYGDGEKLTLVDVDAGLFSATAVVEHTYRDFTKERREPTGETSEMVGIWADGQREVAYSPTFRVIEKEPLVTRKAQIPLAVRWTHPRFFLQHVAFIPS